VENVSGEGTLGLEIIGGVVIAIGLTIYLFIRFSKKNR
jgi:hypothetical protein